MNNPPPKKRKKKVIDFTDGGFTSEFVGNDNPKSEDKQ